MKTRMTRPLCLLLITLMPLWSASADVSECTPNAYKMGKKAARNACEEIVNGIKPVVPPSRPVACSPQDTKDCQRAMKNFLKGSNLLQKSCKERIISGAVIVHSFHENEAPKTAKALWKTTMYDFCEFLPE